MKSGSDYQQEGESVDDTTRNNTEEEEDYEVTLPLTPPVPPPLPLPKNANSTTEKQRNKKISSLDERIAAKTRVEPISSATDIPNADENVPSNTTALTSPGAFAIRDGCGYNFRKKVSSHRHASSPSNSNPYATDRRRIIENIKARNRQNERRADGRDDPSAHCNAPTSSVPGGAADDNNRSAEESKCGIESVSNTQDSIDCQLDPETCTRSADGGVAPPGLITLNRNNNNTQGSDDSINAINLNRDVKAYIAPPVYDAVSVHALQDNKETEQKILKKYKKKAMFLAFGFIVILAAIVTAVFLFTQGKKETSVDPDPGPTNTSVPDPGPTGTSDPRTVKFFEAFDYFVKNNIESEEVLSNKNSPQWKALSWISNEDPIGEGLNVNSHKFRHRFSIAVLYYAMNGPAWGLCNHETLCLGAPSWRSEDDECDWKGIKCANNTLSEINLEFDKNLFMKGEFPDEFCFFEEIKKIELASHSISGTLPPCFGSFSKLEKLILADNSITGMFPASDASGTRKLSWLDLKRNSLQGEVPAHLFDAPELEYINIASNSFNGPLPNNIGKKVKTIDARDNSLTGEIPSALYDAQLLEKIFLQKNGFTGRLRPDFFVSLSNLDEVILSDNSFSGEIPKDLPLFSKLTRLRLENNQFQGEISSRICDEYAKVPSSEIKTGGKLKVLTVDCKVVKCECCPCLS